MAPQKKSMLYTRSGDAGTTALFGGGRVPKDSLRVEAYGCVDELNSALGVAACPVQQLELLEIIATIQNELFNIGSELASETGKASEAGHMFTDEGTKVAYLEALIDEYDAKVEPLRTFILPGGSSGAARLHFCRTVCRRAERAVVRLARDEKERLKLWKCRKQAFGAIGRLSPSYCTQDGVVPRTKLPQILRRIHEISRKWDIRVVNVFHAGDGNIHPILLFDERDSEQTKRVLEASNEILDACLECGGSVTGEHGIGVEKIHFMRKMFTDSDLAAMTNLRDALNPKNNLSPDKLLPTAGGCGMEQKHPGRRAAL